MIIRWPTTANTTYLQFSEVNRLP